MKNLKQKTFIAFHRHFIQHEGHAESNKQAKILANYIITRKYMKLWIDQLHRNAINKEKVAEMRAQMEYKIKVSVFEEWQSISLARQLYLAQKQTAEMFYGSQVVKKAFLSIKFFTKFTQKQRFMDELQSSHGKVRLCRKVLQALKENIVNQNHKKEKYLLVFQVNEFNIQRSAFRLFKSICQGRRWEREARAMAGEHFAKKVLSRIWKDWCIYKLKQSKKRLNYNLADHFRIQYLQRSLMENIKMTNQIFKTVYSEQKMDGIYNERILIKALTSLFLYQQKQVQKLRSLPPNASFYTVADLWLQDQDITTLPGIKYQRLKKHFERRVAETYKLRVM